MAGPSDILPLHMVQFSVAALKRSSKKFTAFYISLSKHLSATLQHVRWQAYVMRGLETQMGRGKKRKHSGVSFKLCMFLNTLKGLGVAVDCKEIEHKEVLFW